jgi:uncharacterized membrane protein YgdD (TMEM256/DUF423 family)
MSYRIWLFITGLTGATAVAAGAIGSHVLKPEGAMLKAYESAQLFHALHAIALLAVAVLLAVTAGRRNAWGALMLQFAALGFLGGIALFSGGIYMWIGLDMHPPSGLIPAGGTLLMAGWLSLGLSAFGLRHE